MTISLGEFTASLEEIIAFLTAALGVAELGVMGTVVVVTILLMAITMVVSLLVSLVVFILEAIPLYKISRKMGRKSAWLVWLSWLPIVGSYLGLYVLEEIPGRKPLHLVGKLSIESRMLSFWIYVGIAVFGNALITAVVGILSLIPVVGTFVGYVSWILYLAPAAALAWMEYAYLRDVLDIFKEDHRSNIIAAAVVAALDATVTMGLARAFFLYTVMNKEPLPQPIVDAE